VTACADGSVRVWHYGDKQTCEKTFNLYPPTHEYAQCGGTLRCAFGAMAHNRAPPASDMQRCQVAFHPNGQLLAVGGATGAHSLCLSLPDTYTG
jgi:WD40 repeat protein